MHPRTNPSLPPQFHELDEYAFQYLCRDLLEVQESIATCEIYGKRGRQKQYGIDLLGHLKDGSGIEVGQCKCYKDFHPSDIRNASDEFLKYLAYWQERKTKRFILFVACPLDTTKQQEAILEQRQRFADVGIVYEPWAANTLRQKLGPHREIVSRYIQSDDVIKQICGEAIIPIGPHDYRPGEKVAFEVLGSEIKKLSSQLSIEKEKQLEEIRELYRKGHQIQALSSIEALLNEPGWSHLENSIRAKILRVLATYSLNLKKDLARAKTLAIQARELAPEANDFILQALILYHEKGPSHTLQTITTVSNIETFNFQLALLLELGKYDDLVSSIEKIPENIVIDAETRRLHAWALVSKGEIISAQRQIQTAVANQPSWQSIRFLAAVINYLRALSPSVLPSQPISRPEPVDWSFVKRDIESINHLRKAEKEFKILADDAELEDTRSNLFTIWRLACLANDPEKQSEAESFCQTLHSEDPTNSMILIWGISRSFNLDWEASIEALEGYSKDSSDYIDKTIALLAIYLGKGYSEKALSLLADSRILFEEKHALDIWIFWQVQAEITIGRLQDASTTAKSCSNIKERFVLEDMALRALATQSGDWNALASHLENSFKETGDSRFLLEYCQVQAKQKLWAVIVSKAEQLMTEIGTQDALRLTAQATWEVQQYDKCLNLITTFSHLYPASILSNDLFRLKVLCQAKIGQLSDAVANADDLARKDPSSENLITLLDIQLMKGDLKGLSLTATKLFTHEDLDSKNLLRIGRLVIFENFDLARKFWKRAINLGVDDSELGFAIDLGFRLGLDLELGPLWHRARALAEEGTGPFQPAGITELRSWAHAKNQNISFVNGKYNVGEIPIHFLAERLRVTLSYIFRTLIQGNEHKLDPEVQPVILVRHGGRHLQSEFSKPPSDWRLHLDITSFLFAAELGILDEIEQFFKPLRISKHLPSSLVIERDSLSAHQPALLEGYKEILQLNQEGILHPTPHLSAISTTLIDLKPKMGLHWLALLTSTLGNNSILVDFLPLVSNDGNMEHILIPTLFSEKITNCRTLIESLRQNGHLSHSAYQRVLEDMGNEGSLEPEPILPPPGSTMYFMANTISVLSKTNALRTTCEQFNVYVDADFLREIQHAIEQEKNRNNLVLWLGTLLDRVNLGLENGNYQTFECGDVLSGMSASGEAIRDYNSLSLLELYGFIPQSEDVICVDDRFSNGFTHQNGAPIISLLEILEVLKRNKKINEEKAFQIYLKLRAANVRYIPLSSEEILFHLEQAQIVDGVLIETRELSILRRYFASCLLDVNRLQRLPMPAGASNSQGELAFVLGTLRATKDAIMNCWRNPNSNTSTIHADWILENMFTGTFGVQHLRPVVDPNSDGLDLIGLDIGGAFSGGVSLIGKGEEITDGKNPRQQYFEWVEDRLLWPRLLSDPGAKTAIAQAVYRFIADQKEVKASTAEEELSQKILLQQLYFDIPEIIKDEMKSDPEFLGYIGVQVVESVGIGDMVFPKSDFWVAASKAMGGEICSAKALEPEGTCTLEQVINESGPQLAIKIRRDANSTEFIFENPALGLLHGTPKDWEKLLKDNRHWFDCETNEFDDAIDEILTITDAQMRIERVHQWQGESTSLFYSHLANSLKNSNKFKFDELIPSSAAGLLRHYRIRLPGGGFNFQQVIEEASYHLMAEEGFNATLLRMICIPSQLPDPILNHYGNLAVEERQQIILDVSTTSVAPVCRIHLIFLALKFDGESTWGVEISRQLLSSLFEPERAEGDFLLFKSLLCWVSDEFAYWADTNVWPPSVRLAMVWAHACQLYNIFQKVGAHSSELAKYFERKRFRMTPEIFARDFDYWNDVSHPRQFNRPVFLLHSLSNLFRPFDKALLDDISLTEKLKEFAIQGSGDFSATGLQLIRDSMLAPNNLGSFLGGDRWGYLKEILDLDQSDRFTSPALRSMADSALDSLIHTQNSGPEWLKLSAVIGDLPIYSDLKDKARTLLEKINFEELFEHDKDSAVLALYFTSEQALHVLNEGERSCLIDKVLKFAERVHKQLAEHSPVQPEASQKSEDRIIEFIFQAILTLSVKPKDPRETTKTFSNLLRRLINMTPNFLGSFRSGLTRFLFELPSSHLHGLWEAVLLARARAKR